MARNLFDHLKGITKDKIKWSSLSEEDRKTWNSYMMTRWLSMEPELLDTINFFQQYSNEILLPKDYYNLLYDALPSTSFFLKYIKKKQKVEIDPKFIDLFCKHYQLGKRNIYDYILFLKRRNPSELITIMQSYGTTEEDIKLFEKQLEAIQ